MQVSAVGCCRGRCSERSLPVPIALQRRGHTHIHIGSAGAEQLGHSTPDLNSEKNSNIRNRGEHEDWKPGVQEPLGTAPERAFGGGQDGGDTHDPVQHGGSRGQFLCPGYSVVRTYG